MKKLVLAIVLIALLASCASENFKPVGPVLFYEWNGEKGRLHIRHADGPEYVCVVVAKFEELIKDGFVNAGEQFDCTGLTVYRQDSTVTF